MILLIVCMKKKLAGKRTLFSVWHPDGTFKTHRRNKFMKKNCNIYVLCYTFKLTRVTNPVLNTRWNMSLA